MVNVRLVLFSNYLGTETANAASRLGGCDFFDLQGQRDFGVRLAQLGRLAVLTLILKISFVVRVGDPIFGEALALALLLTPATFKKTFLEGSKPRLRGALHCHS
jgi:hypothetical protein